MEDLQIKRAETPKTNPAFAPAEFDAIRLALASPEQILNWSHGEVTKAETINYRTQKPEKDGLFDERIFGPTRDWECYCGKYKRIRYKDVVCDKCGVKVTRSIVRRERMGHIMLAVPVTHIWFLRGTPSTIGAVLNIGIKELERVVYFASYIVMSVDDSKRLKALAELNKQKPEEGQTAEDLAQLKADLEGLSKYLLLPEGKYRELEERYAEVFTAGIGAESILQLLKEIDLDKLVKDLTKESEASQGQKKKKILKRLKMLEGMKQADIRPEWTVITHLPVIPPDLRPMVQLAGGRFAASDLNDLYRRVINRNNRLKRLIELDAPEVIQRNEKRMLQEAVDALIDNNARRERAVSSTGGRRKLKSLSDMLKGKQGRFRQNLLGKRVDYSGRSVIVAGPALRLHQCGIPKMMALELFKPFVMGRLIEEGFAHNVKSAGRMIERSRTEVWDMLEEIITDKYVLLNRAPTLHRLGIQAFKPVLIEGKAIRLHPLVCAAFNADFDGDQMAVHVPLSIAAQEEAREIMLSSKNLLKPANGAVITNPSQDMVLGIYYLTHALESGDKLASYSSVSEALHAYERGQIKLQTLIRVALTEQGEVFETTVGRILFNEILPEGMPFQNQSYIKKTLQQLVATIFSEQGSEKTAYVIDEIKNLGFEYATKSGMSIGVDDFISPAKKDALLAEAEQRVIEISQQYAQGLITEDERYQRTVDIWKQANEQIMALVEQTSKENSTSMTIFVETGARGDLAQVNQIAGMVGLVQDPSSRIIELPVKSNYKEGLSVLEYFNSTHGARKGLTDTALKTAESGYLTRRLVDVAQDVFITSEDCGDKEGLIVSRAEGLLSDDAFAYRIAGRVAGAKVADDKGKILVKTGDVITEPIAQAIAASKIEQIKVRSVLRCQSLWGICRNCYGLDLGRGGKVRRGEPVGVIAAQSIGEPGTQLTMKVFHKGGVAGEDITSGLPRVEEIFEVRNPKGQAILAEADGVVAITQAEGKQNVRITPPDLKVTEYDLTDKVAQVKAGDRVKPGDVLAADKNGKKPVKARTEGLVEIKKKTLQLLHAGDNFKEYSVPAYIGLEVRNGDLVAKGQKLTEGSINLQDMLRLLGEGAVERYIVDEVQAIYAAQGEPVSDKHIEIMVRQMLSRVQIEESGDGQFVSGDIVSKAAVIEENQKLREQKKQSATFQQLLLGVTKVSISADSFLSAASFQDTTRVLINAAIRGKVDHLRGLKENVIIGRLIPVGTGFHTVDGEAPKR